MIRWLVVAAMLPGCAGAGGAEKDSTPDQEIGGTNRGAEPRQKLALGLQPGKHASSWTVEVTETSSVDGRSLEASDKATFVWQVEVAEVDADGGAQATLLLVEPAGGVRMNPDYVDVLRLRYGEPTAFRVGGYEPKSITAVPAPSLPPYAVGVGATWGVKGGREGNRIEESYELTALSEQGFKVKYERLTSEKRGDSGGVQIEEQWTGEVEFRAGSALPVAGGLERRRVVTGAPSGFAEIAELVEMELRYETVATTSWGAAAEASYTPPPAADGCSEAVAFAGALATGVPGAPKVLMPGLSSYVFAPISPRASRPVPEKAWFVGYVGDLKQWALSNAPFFLRFKTLDDSFAKLGPLLRAAKQRKMRRAPVVLAFDGAKKLAPLKKAVSGVPENKRLLLAVQAPRNQFIDQLVRLVPQIPSWIREQLGGLPGPRSPIDNLHFRLPTYLQSAGVCASARVAVGDSLRVGAGLSTAGPVLADALEKCGCRGMDADAVLAVAVAIGYQFFESTATIELTAADRQALAAMADDATVQSFAETLQ